MKNHKEIMSSEKFKLACDGLFSAMRIKNTKLLNLSNQTYDVSFNDAIDFSITSNAISIIKSYFYGSIHSYTNILLLRNIIEDFSLKEMYLKGDMPKESSELIKYNGFIEDYKQYKDLKGEEYKKIVDYDKLVEDYQGSLSIYKKYGINEKDINKMNIPFILDKKITYLDLIKKYLKSFLSSYKLLSFYIHPHNYSTEGSNDNIERIFIYVFTSLFEYYKDDLSLIKSKNSFTSERSLLLAYMLELPDNYDFHFYKYCIEQNMLMTELKELIIKKIGTNNYVEHLLAILPDINCDICTDSIHAQSENCKAKFKTILEIFALYDWLFFSDEYDEKHFKLLNYYSAIKENDAYDYKYEENYIKAFEIFKKLYPKANDYQKFRKVFGKTLGFTINENYNKMSLNEMINRFIDRNFTGNIISDGTKMDVFIRVLYSESCSIGHGKAYSFFSNSGAFLEDMNIIYITDMLICTFFLQYNMKLVKIDKEKEYIELEDKIDDFINKINSLSYKKMEIMKMKVIKFDFENYTIK